MPDPQSIIPAERIAQQIMVLRGQRVLLDADLAELYGVETRVLNQAVRRNANRFPEDFAFQLTPEEVAILKSQFVTSSWGGRRKPPLAFTEQGVAMLSSVLHSPRAVQVNVEIMRTFVRLREFMATNQDLAQRLEGLERKSQKHDLQLQEVFEAIRLLLLPPAKLPAKIGFKSPETGEAPKAKRPRK